MQVQSESLELPFCVVPYLQSCSILAHKYSQRACYPVASWGLAPGMVKEMHTTLCLTLRNLMCWGIVRPTGDHQGVDSSILWMCSAGSDMEGSCLNSLGNWWVLSEDCSLLGHLAAGPKGGLLPTWEVQVLSLILLLCPDNSYLFKEWLRGNLTLFSRGVMGNKNV